MIDLGLESLDGMVSTSLWDQLAMANEIENDLDMIDRSIGLLGEMTAALKLADMNRTEAVTAVESLGYELSDLGVDGSTEGLKGKIKSIIISLKTKLLKLIRKIVSGLTGKHDIDFLEDSVKSIEDRLKRGKTDGNVMIEYPTAELIKAFESEVRQLTAACVAFDLMDATKGLPSHHQMKPLKAFEYDSKIDVKLIDDFYAKRKLSETALSDASTAVSAIKTANFKSGSDYAKKDLGKLEKAVEDIGEGDIENSSDVKLAYARAAYALRNYVKVTRACKHLVKRSEVSTKRVMSGRPVDKDKK